MIGPNLPAHHESGDVESSNVVENFPQNEQIAPEDGSINDHDQGNGLSPTPSSSEESFDEIDKMISDD